MFGQVQASISRRVRGILPVSGYINRTFQELRAYRATCRFEAAHENFEEH
jgi:hypothetical protein